MIRIPWFTLQSHLSYISKKSTAMPLSLSNLEILVISINIQNRAYLQNAGHRLELCTSLQWEATLKSTEVKQPVSLVLLSSSLVHHTTNGGANAPSEIWNCSLNGSPNTEFASKMSNHRALKIKYWITMPIWNFQSTKWKCIDITYPTNKSNAQELPY